MAPQRRVYYGPDEDENTIDLERYFVAGDFITGTGFGVQLVLWTTCVMYFWRDRKRRGWRAIFLIGYLSVLISIQFIYCIDQANTVQVMYVDNRNYPGGPWQYFLNLQDIVLKLGFYATLFVGTFLCDLIVLWRCYVIWTISGRPVACAVVAFPTLILIGSFVMGTLWTLQSSHPGLSLYSKEPLAFGTAYYALSLGLNIVLTALILLKLLMYRHKHLVHLPPEHSSQYLSLVALIIESAALYSAFAVMFLVSYGLNKPINQIWLGFAQAAQQIATYLILYRLATGTAWSKETMQTRPLTTIQFNKATSSDAQRPTDTSAAQITSNHSSEQASEEKNECSG
ncbi:hypothetical protein BD311DRAFT_790911 [Dichomitus squalens]|uniref:Uncharacterized protein n=1 Tax=Dichomitus squalens TaxID=114155 RepID=A0A4Q9MFI2_9APHY|nr:hypothetical protein BD311DRAFT_790911 [Dichomitus squalens]